MSHDHHQSAQIRSEPVPPCSYTTACNVGIALAMAVVQLCMPGAYETIPSVCVAINRQCHNRQRMPVNEGSRISGGLQALQTADEDAITSFHKFGIR